MNATERQMHKEKNEKALKILGNVLDRYFEGEEDGARQRIIRSALTRVTREVRK